MTADCMKQGNSLYISHATILRRVSLHLLSICRSMLLALAFAFASAFSSLQPSLLTVSHAVSLIASFNFSSFRIYSIEINCNGEVISSIQ